MTPLSLCAVSTVSVVPGTVLKTKKLNCSTRFGFSRKLKTHTLSRQSVLLSLSTPSALRLPYSRGFTFHYGSRIHPLSATGTDVAVEEPDSPVEDEVSPSIAENPNVEPEASRTPAQSTRTRSVKKSEMPPVKNEELVPGATFTGKVRSIQPFGAFIDFGAFTDGLVHVSRLSDSYVKDVGSFVSVGQEVKVRLVEANMESGRISLTMRESDDTSKLQQRKDGPTSSDKAGSARRNASNPNQKRGETRKVSKFVKGQDLDGTVKNIARAGAFISLPEGEEGFLPVSEELDEGFGTAMGETSLQIGQEVSVRVLRIARGQVTLTMKKEENVQKVDLQFTQGVVHTATNPFVVAFRKNKDIATFLDEKEKIEKDAIKPLATTSLEELEGKELKPDAPEMQDQPIISEEKDTSASLLDESIEIETHSEETEAKAKEVSPETVGDYGLSNSSAETIDQILPLETPSVKEELQQQPEDAVKKEEMQNQTPNADNKVLSSAPAGDEEVGPDSRENGRITSSGVQPDDASVQVAQGTLVSEVEENLNDNIKDEVKAQPPATKHETPVASKFEDDKAASNPEKTADVTNSSGQNDIPFPEENVTKVTATISPALVKQLREDTGAGMMDCKKALSETGGDIVKAQEFLRKKGLASAEKKASRATAEGRIGSYIHDGRIGVLVEINCETDFVSRGDIFKELVDDMAMQVAASPQVQYLATEDVPKEIVSKEREIEMQKEDLSSKPEQIRSRIVEGRINKRLEELALLEQPFIKNDKIVVKDLVKQTIATIGENIKVKRFVRYNLGEGLEKKSQDFAAEVAAQTAAKPEPKQHPAAKEPVQKALTVAVSASLVKQLREETGAGMMDCKKALAETGGVIEKAQEYLRKKGLSSAEKKSSRLAAEGRIGSYIHDSRVGVLIEVNCETDFVGRSEKFKELVDDLAMQIVACPQVQFVSIEDIPESIVNKEKELEMQREDILSKPENIRGRIVEGRISKRLGELALLEQPFVKNDSFIVKDLVKQTVAALGENIKVRRFVRFTLGETVENAKAEPET